MEFNTSVAQPSPAALDIKPPASPSPMEIIAQMQEPRMRQMQMQTMGMENQQRALDLQDQQIMRTMLPQMLGDPSYKGADGSPDWDKITTNLAGHVTPKAAFSLQQMMLGNQEKRATILKTHADVQKINGELEKQEQDYFGNQAAKIAQNGYSTPMFELMLHDAESMNPTYAEHVKAIREQLAQNPDAIKMITDGLVSKSGAATKEQREQTQSAATVAELQAKTTAQTRQNAIQELSALTDQDGKITNPQAFGQWQQKYKDIAPPGSDPQSLQRFARSGVPAKDQPEYDINTYKARMGLIGNGEYDQFLAAYAKKLGKTPSTLTPDEALASFGEFAELKRDPVMRALAISQMHMANAMKQMQMDQMPTQQDAAMFADDILNHRLAPDQISQIRGRSGGSLGIMIEREMKKQNPTFNWEEASAEYNLAKSQGFQQTVRYMDYVGSSLNNVIAAADKLNNGKVRSINAVKNWGADQLNGVDIARFNTDRLEVSDAIAKILQGGGTGSGTSDMKLKQAQDLIKQTDNPAVVRAVSSEIQTLIGNRRKTLTKGTYMENAQPADGNQGGSFEVKDPRGVVHTFPTQEAANAFKQAAGIQ